MTGTMVDDPTGGAYSYQNRGSAKQALGDLDGGLTDINEAIGSIRHCPPDQPCGDLARQGQHQQAITDCTEAIRLAKASAAANIIMPPGSMLISACTQRALACEA
jgi:hypothetical protein